MSECDRSYIQERIVISDNGCWEWQASCDQYGYGQINMERGDRLAHRLSYRAFTGSIPLGKVVRHTCDNPPCCNPDHLILGWQADNLADARERGRAYCFSESDQAEGRRISADLRRIPTSIEEDIVQRFNKGERREAIANHHRIHVSTTNRIIRRHTNG